MIEDRESMMRRFSVNDSVIGLKSVERDEIAQHIAEYLAGGGVIRTAAAGQSSDFDPAVVYRNYPAVDSLNSNDHSLPFAARYLGVGERSLRKLLAMGKGPVHAKLTKGELIVYRFRMADLTNYKNTMEPRD